MRGRTVHWIATRFDPPRLVRTEFRDDQDRVREVRSYEDFEQVAAGVWRALRCTESRYRPGEAGPHFVRGLRIHALELMTAEEAAQPFEPPRSARGWWFVHL